MSHAAKSCPFPRPPTPRPVSTGPTACGGEPAAFPDPHDPQEQANAAMWRSIEQCHVDVMGRFDRELGQRLGPR